MFDSIKEIEAALGNGILAQVVVVDDGSVTGFSSDIGDFLIRRDPRMRIIRSDRNMGKGHAVRQGITTSRSDIQIYTDVDLPYLNRHVIEFYHLLNTDMADVVVASRSASYYDSLSLFRRWLSHAMRYVNRFAFGLKVNDTQGGLKGMNRRGREVFLGTRINRYLFDLEFIQRASEKKLRIVPVHVELKEGIVLPTPGLRILLNESGNLLRLLLRV